MPQDVDFGLPFPPRMSADLASATRHNTDWVREFGLVVGEAAVDWYVSWDMPKLAARGYPYAAGDGLALCADTMAFFFLFDDQFDGPLGRQPSRAAVVVRDLIGVVHDLQPRTENPLTRAFRDIWARARHGADSPWCVRTAHEWEYYFASYAHEAINRCRGVPADMERFLEVRRGMSGTGLPISLGERAAGVQVPPVAFHSPQMRIMRQITTDVTFMCNDVYSLEKEAARGDMDNVVLVIEKENGLCRADAIGETCRRVRRRCTRFCELAAEIPALCQELGLDATRTSAVHQYVEVMSAWIRGYHDWETETLRYTTSHQVVPHTRPGYFHGLL
ncbi:terpene cyclase [Streptomyces sp. TRM66268-LWL]|uniref:Terpene synthase n=1 Tax=Streptomyces polyasparticus TaxID=2767826 RepID=A0ABR7STV4_9ACTN|nr:terpene cyclase [Streptomyces polyasparticus]MBC9718927.1 terpene cyclase [Streptomyces polyasparticus]